jgi:hypothetical protein
MNLALHDHADGSVCPQNPGNSRGLVCLVLAATRFNQRGNVSYLAGVGDLALRPTKLTVCLLIPSMVFVWFVHLRFIVRSARRGLNFALFYGTFCLVRAVVLVVLFGDVIGRTIADAIGGVVMGTLFMLFPLDVLLPIIAMVKLRDWFGWEPPFDITVA